MRTWRVFFFGVVLLVVVTVVARSDGHYTNVARLFLSNLLRQLF